MNEKIGPLSFPKDENSLKPYSEEVAFIMDVEVRKIIETAYEKAIQVLTEKRDALDKLAKILLEKEVIHIEDIKNILGERPWKIPGYNS